jgi:hypothetical protein
MAADNPFIPSALGHAELTVDLEELAAGSVVLEVEEVGVETAGICAASRLRRLRTSSESRSISLSVTSQRFATSDGLVVSVALSTTYNGRPAA